jgi:hypothetical protein
VAQVVSRRPLTAETQVNTRPHIAQSVKDVMADY